MTDRKGLSYETLVAVQTADLALWGSKCRPEVIQPVTEYVRSQNRCATQPEETHRVYRGQDLIEIIRQWPNLQSPYASIPNLDEV
jgi:hypothetical protein